MNKLTITRSVCILTIIFLVAIFVGTAKSTADLGGVNITPGENIGGIVSKDDIPFNDPAHIFYFRYQAWRVQNKKAGETVESWNRLLTTERVEKITIGEVFLKKLRIELTAKPILNGEESALFQAVWGNVNIADYQENVSRPLAAQKEPTPKETETVVVLSEKLNSFKDSGDWGQLFDGSQLYGNSPHGMLVAGKSDVTNNPLNHNDKIIPIQSISRTESTNNYNGLVMFSLPAEEKESGTSKTVPVIAGVILLAAFYFSVQIFRNKTGMTGGIPVVSDLHTKVMSELDSRSVTGLYNDLSNSSLGIAGESRAGTCKSTCSGTCKGGCQGNCKGDCWGSCKGDCGDNCKGDCGMDCKGDCSTGCSGSCQGDCEGGCAVKTAPLGKIEILSPIQQALHENGYPR